MRVLAYILALGAGWALGAPMAWGQVEVLAQTCQSVALGETAACEITLAGQGAVTLSFERPGAGAGPPPGAVIDSTTIVTALSDLTIHADTLYALSGTYIEAFTFDLVRRRYQFIPVLEFLNSSSGLVFVDGEPWKTEIRLARNCGCLGTAYARLIRLTDDFQLTGDVHDIPYGGPVGPYDTGIPNSLVYDAALARFYYRDNVHHDLWAFDHATMTPVAGYPRPLTSHSTGPRTVVSRGLSLTRRPAAEGGGVYLESAVGPYNSETGHPQRIAALDPATGANLGPETPLPFYLRGYNPPGYLPTGWVYTVQRSAAAPDSVLYFVAQYGYLGGGMQPYLFAVHPAYVPPYGVSFSAGAFPFTLIELVPGEPQTVTVTFERRETLPGSYEGEVVVRRSGWYQTQAGPEATAAEALAVVPVTLVVNAVSTEGEPGRGEAVGLSVYPNPARGRASVSVSLSAASVVEVSVYDVLGRRVAEVVEGPVAAGEHAFSVDVSGLAPGAYVVRAGGNGFAESRRITVVR